MTTKLAGCHLQKMVTCCSRQEELKITVTHEILLTTASSSSWSSIQGDKSTDSAYGPYKVSTVHVKSNFINGLHKPLMNIIWEGYIHFLDFIRGGTAHSRLKIKTIPQKLTVFTAFYHWALLKNLSFTQPKIWCTIRVFTACRTFWFLPPKWLNFKQQCIKILKPISIFCLGFI